MGDVVVLAEHRGGGQRARRELTALSSPEMKRGRRRWRLVGVGRGSS